MPQKPTKPNKKAISESSKNPVISNAKGFDKDIPWIIVENKTNQKQVVKFDEGSITLKARESKRIDNITKEEAEEKLVIYLQNNVLTLKTQV